MLSEARDERRRQASRLVRRLWRGGAEPHQFLLFLSGAARLFPEAGFRPRRRPAAGRRYLL